MMTLRGSPSFFSVKDIRSAVRRADISGMLNTVELLDIAALLRCAAGAIAYVSGDRSEKTAIDTLFDGLTANKFLEGKISTSIIGVDEIADAASTELADIRRHMRVAGDRIRQSLNKSFLSGVFQGAAGTDHHRQERSLCRTGEGRSKNPPSRALSMTSPLRRDFLHRADGGCPAE